MWATNRTAISISGKQPLVDWINQLPDSEIVVSLQELESEATIYLVPEVDESQDIIELIEMVLPSIWMEQLSAWCEDEKLWPENHLEENFGEWFDLKFANTVYDFVDADIQREDL